MSVPKGVSYWLRNKLYLSLTNRTVSAATPLSLRGPSFVMPKESDFAPLPEGFEPTAASLVEVVEQSFAEGRINVDSMRSDEVSFAGLGEPLLRLDCIEEVVRAVRESRHGARFRVKTSGLVLSRDAAEVSARLKDCGVKMVSIALLADSPKLYEEIVQPTNGAGFGDVCSFTIACLEAGTVCMKLLCCYCAPFLCFYFFLFIGKSVEPPA